LLDSEPRYGETGASFGQDEIRRYGVCMTGEATDEPSGRRLNAHGRSRQFVTALSRGLDVLAAFGPQDRSLGNQDIAKRTGLPKPTVSRLTYTLTELNYLVFHEHLGRYSLSPRVLELGYTALASSGISEIARPVMRDLSEMDDVAVALGVRSKLGIRFIEFVRRPEAVVASLEVGSVLPMLHTAIGRAYLAHLPDAARAAMLAELRKTDPSIPAGGGAALARAVKDMQRLGYVQSIGEWRPEINAIATVIETADANEPLLMNMGAMASTLTPKRIERKFGPALIDAARRIESRMRNVLMQ
jgi:DNA-binding IclR family transcriptional regulator